MLRLVQVDGARLVTITGPQGVGKRRFAAELATELADVPGLTLETAARPLGLPGERAYRLRPLAESPAVELFRQRAEVNDPDFDASYAELADLSRRLGRLPLAIELFAAHGRAALDEPPGRVLTLPDAIEWAYGRLEDAEKEALRRFADGGSIDDETADRLLRLRLLAPTASGLAMHPAIRAFAAAA